MTTREIRNLNTDDLIGVIRRAAYGETVYAGAAIIHKDDNTGYAVASMLTSLSVADRSVIEDAVNKGVRSIEQRGAYPEKSFVFDIPADDEGRAGYHGRLLAIVELYMHEPMTPSINKGCQTQVLVRLTQANPDMPGVDEKALQDLEDALNATGGMRAGMSSYLITGNPRDLLDGLQAADSEN